MSEDIPLVWKTKILDLEDQVRGLRETVNQFYKLYSMAYAGVQKPDHYVQTPPAGGYTVADLQARMASMDLRPALAISDGTPDVMMPPPVEESTDLTPSVETLDMIAAETAITAEEASQLPKYTYSPLDESASEVRFLALKSSQNSTESEPISCRIVTASLDDVPSERDFWPSSALQLYNPLSYCWGQGEATKEIILDGCSFKIRPSLHDALSHFRQTKLESSDAFWHGAQDTSETYWWIDAICVNQEDMEERKSQVALMSRLYRSAHTVRVWLGPEADNSALAMDIVRKLAYRPDDPEEEYSWEYSRENPGKTHRPGGPGRPMIEIKQPDAGPPISSLEKKENYSALVKLFQRPWFSRVWVQQEAALPEFVEVHCGQETCSWETMMSTVDMMAYLVDECHLPALQIDNLRNPSHSFMSCFSETKAIDKLRKEVLQNGQAYGEFEQLVSLCRGCKATDPRDKIYALLPMTSPDEFELDADYTLEKKVMYRNTIMKLLDQGSLGFLDWCQDPFGSTGLPSWVPDLESQWEPLPVEEVVENITYTDEDNTTATDAPIDYNYIEAENKLQVKGVIFDYIQDIDREAFVSKNSSNEEVMETVLHWQEFDAERRQVLQEEWRQLEQALEDSGADYVDFDRSVSIYGNIIHAEGDDWTEQITGHMRNRELSRHEWDDDDYGDYDPQNIDNDPILRLFKRYLPLESTVLSEYLGRKSQFYAWFRSLAVGRRFVFTAKGGHALLPEKAEIGDALCFFAGHRTPFVIRQAGGNEWAIVGTA
ncbi:hypothetical protein Golomagni_06056, partial [Golovinomyces magnicellulatus]